MAEPVCRECRYWRELPYPTGKGQCRQCPPTIAQAGRNHWMTAWPETYPDDWCGQFASRDISVSMTVELSGGEHDAG